MLLGGSRWGVDNVLPVTSSYSIWLFFSPIIYLFIRSRTRQLATVPCFFSNHLFSKSTVKVLKNEWIVPIWYWPVWVRMCRLSKDGRSNAFPHTWQGKSGRWRAGRPEDADETEVMPLARPPLPLVMAAWWWWWLWISKVSDEASRPDMLLAISSAPEDRPADCSLDTDWRPSDAPPELAAAPTCCLDDCCGWLSGVGDEAAQDDVKSDRDKSSGLSKMFSSRFKF